MVKISIIGAGRVGATAAFALASRQLCDEIVLLDIPEKTTQTHGEALDIRHAALCSVSGTAHYEDTASSELIIVTAGFPRTQNESRLDLTERNRPIIETIAQNAVEFSPKAKLLIVTNPNDLMTLVALRASGLPCQKVFGMGSLLDSMRFRALLAHHYKIPANKVEAIVIGEHNTTMIPIIGSVKIDGKTPKAEEAKIIAEQVKEAGKEIITLKSGTQWAPATSIVKMAEAVILDKHEEMPAQVYLEDKKICIGIMAEISRDGACKPRLPEMNDDERESFDRSVKELQKLAKEIKLI